jgi:hypothetical protein
LLPDNFLEKTNIDVIVNHIDKITAIGKPNRSKLNSPNRNALSANVQRKNIDIKYDV